MIRYKSWTIPEGNVVQVTDESGAVIWAVSGGKVILQVEKITADTYAGETTYTSEQFILLDIYPKTNGTVTVTYGGLTKTITDTSGAEKPNAQQVFFGTFNGVSDSVVTPESGELTIEGDYCAFGGGGYSKSSKNTGNCNCVTAVNNIGEITFIPDRAFSSGSYDCKLSTIKIPNTVLSIGSEAFSGSEAASIVIPKSVKFIGYQAFCYMNFDESLLAWRTVKVLPTTPPEIGILETSPETPKPQMAFDPLTDETVKWFTIKEIIVPEGCGNAYKTAAGWSQYADYIVEAS